MRSLFVLVGALLLTAGVAFSQVTPPEYLNYQGVLRDASDEPLDGLHSMIFRFYDTDGGPSCTGGTLLLVDAHLAAGGRAVEVTGGMFNVALGSGIITAGTASTLGEVFRDNVQVWLEPDVGGENLCPRIRVVSAGYALNAANLGGHDASHFVDTSTTSQVKDGPFTADASGNVGTTGVRGFGTYAGGYFEETGGTGKATLGWAGRGISAEGAVRAGNFYNSNNTAWAHVATEDAGIESFGYTMGGFFRDEDITSYSQVAFGGKGIHSYGDEMGGRFEDRDGTSWAHVAYGDTGIEAFGTDSGGYFKDSNGTGEAYVGRGNRGIYGYGSDMGGYFYNTNNTAWAYVGSDGVGIEAFGYSMGGFFRDEDITSYSQVAFAGKGIHSYGDEMGGKFEDRNASGYAHVAYGNRGIEAFGSGAAGYFEETDTDAKAWVAWKDAGIEAKGGWMGGLFYDATQSGQARLGYGDEGIRAFGNAGGAYFFDADNTSAWVQVGYHESGVNYKIRGGGTVNFVQNHPERSDRVVVYAAPEGDEVAVYTRGTAQLVDGEARVALGETFKWVANPDIGLTAHLTPRRESADLFVQDLTTSELTVRGPAGSRTVFDYIVYGLRLGYEQLAPVQVKQTYAPIPDLDATAPYYEEHPDLRQYNALERFAAMRAALGETEPVDLSDTQELLAAVNRFEPDIDAALLPDADVHDLERFVTEEPDPTADAPATDTGTERVSETADSRTVVAGLLPMDSEGNADSRPSRPNAADFATPVSTSEPVEAGDVLVIDPDEHGLLSRSRHPADARVVGIVTTSAGEVSVAVAGVVRCKVDAGYGSVLAGDLLATSATPGHAMRTIEPAPGTVIGKALEPLDMGTGQIKVLVMPR